MHLNSLSVNDLTNRAETPSVYCVLCIDKAALIIAILIVVLFKCFKLLLQRQILYSDLLLHLLVNSFT
jgi:hypothetical protein